MDSIWRIAGPAKDPPNYRDGTKAEHCGNCSMFWKGHCWGYGNKEVRADGVCDSWDKETRQRYADLLGPSAYPGEDPEERAQEGIDLPPFPMLPEDPSYWYRINGENIDLAQLPIKGGKPIYVHQGSAYVDQMHPGLIEWAGDVGLRLAAIVPWDPHDPFKTGLPRPIAEHPEYGKLPVPWSQEINGKPDSQWGAQPSWGTMGQHAMSHQGSGLCLVCGEPVTQGVVIVAKGIANFPEPQEVYGPQNVQSTEVLDSGPLHQQCASLTAAHCPDVKGGLAEGHYEFVSYQQMPSKIAEYPGGGNMLDHMRHREDIELYNRGDPDWQPPRDNPDLELNGPFSCSQCDYKPKSLADYRLHVEQYHSPQDATEIEDGHFPQTNDFDDPLPLRRTQPKPNSGETVARVGMAADPEWWRQYSQSSPLLYHAVASPNDLSSILKHGLHPWDSPLVGRNTEESAIAMPDSAPRPNTVYLHAGGVFRDPQKRYLAVDTRHLDPRNLMADEDDWELGQWPREMRDSPNWATTYGDGGKSLGDWADHYKWGLDPETTHRSIETGIVGHRGPIPPEAITVLPEGTVPPSHVPLRFETSTNHFTVVRLPDDRACHNIPQFDLYSKLAGFDTPSTVYYGAFDDGDFVGYGVVRESAYWPPEGALTQETPWGNYLDVGDVQCPACGGTGDTPDENGCDYCQGFGEIEGHGYFHTAPSVDRNRIRAHGLVPSSPYHSPHWSEPGASSESLREQPEAVYMTTHYNDVPGPDRFEALDDPSIDPHPHMGYDVWSIDPQYVHSARPDYRWSDHAWAIPHSIPPKALRLHRPAEEDIWSLKHDQGGRLVSKATDDYGVEVMMIQAAEHGRGVGTAILRRIQRDYSRFYSHADTKAGERLMKHCGMVNVRGHLWRWAQGKDPKDMLEATVPFVYDIPKDQLTLGYPGYSTHDVTSPAGFSPGGIVEGTYEPGGKVTIWTASTWPFSVRHLLDLWKAQAPQMEVTGVQQKELDGSMSKLAVLSEGYWNVSGDEPTWEQPQDELLRDALHSWRVPAGTAPALRMADYIDDPEQQWLALHSGIKTAGIEALEVGPYMNSLVQSYPAAANAYKALSQHGGEVYVVGGAVRDYMQGQVPHDVDLMVRGLPAAEVEQILRKLPGGVKLTGKNFGVYRYRNGDDDVEVALPRSDTYLQAGRGKANVKVDHNLPIEDDLLRRDFTANSMAVKLDDGSLVDPYNGSIDLKRGVLRTTHPDSFKEDPTRLVRALTAHGRFGLLPDERTRHEMQTNAHLIRQESPDALNKVTDKLMGSANPAQAIRLGYETGVLHHLLPEVAENWDFDQRNPHHNLPLGEHLVHTLDNVSRLTTDPDVRMAAVLHDIGKPASQWIDSNGVGHYYKNPQTGEGAYHESVGAQMTDARLRALNYPVARINRVRELVRRHMFPAFNDAVGARKFLNKNGELADDLLHLREADQTGKGQAPEEVAARTQASEMRGLVEQAREQQAPVSQAALAINGNDLLQLSGQKPGPWVGQLLNHLTNAVLDNPELNTRDALLGLAQTQIAMQPPETIATSSVENDVGPS